MAGKPNMNSLTNGWRTEYLKKIKANWSQLMTKEQSMKLGGQLFALILVFCISAVTCARHPLPGQVRWQDENRQQKNSGQQGAESDQKESTQSKPKRDSLKIPKDWVRLAKEREIWIDKKNKQVIVAGQVCLREGMLELFACSMETKMHESVVSINARASEVHAGLLAIGAKPGKPVSFDPKYVPATGPKINVTVKWIKDGKPVELKAQEMVRDVKSKKVLDKDWVFGGSMTYVDPETKEKFYYADSGDFICVSNFPTATMDLPIKSTASNESLVYEANKSKIPQLGTKVYLFLKPEVAKEKDKGESKNKNQKPNKSPVNDGKNVKKSGK
jgi:hypothetical protein